MNGKLFLTSYVGPFLSIFLSVVHLNTASASSNSCASFYSQKRHSTDLAVVAPSTNRHRKVYTSSEAKEQLGDLDGGWGFENGRGHYFKAQRQLGNLLNSKLYHQSLVRALKRAGIRDLDKALQFVEHFYDFVEMKNLPTPIINKVYEDTVRHLEADFHYQITSAINNTIDPFGLINFKTDYGFSSLDISTLRTNLDAMKNAEEGQQPLSVAVVWTLLFERGDLPAALKYHWSRVSIEESNTQAVAVLPKQERPSFGRVVSDWLKPVISPKQIPRVYRQSLPELPQSLHWTGDGSSVVSDFAMGRPSAGSRIPIKSRGKVVAELWSLTEIIKYIVNLRNRFVSDRSTVGFPVSLTAEKIKDDTEKLLRMRIDDQFFSYNSYMGKQLVKAVQVHAAFLREFVRFLNKRNLSVHAKEMELFESPENIRRDNNEWLNEMMAIMQKFLDRHNSDVLAKFLEPNKRAEVTDLEDLSLISSFSVTSDFKRNLSAIGSSVDKGSILARNLVHSIDRLDISEFFLLAQTISNLPDRSTARPSQSGLNEAASPPHYLFRLLLTRFLNSTPPHISNFELQFYLDVVEGFQAQHPERLHPEIMQYFDNLRSDLKKLAPAVHQAM